MKKLLPIFLILLFSSLSFANESSIEETYANNEQAEIEFSGSSCSVGGTYVTCGSVKDKYYGGCSISCSRWSRADLALCSQATCMSGGRPGREWVQAAKCSCSE